MEKIITIPMNENSCVIKVSVQVSKYSGHLTDDGVTKYIVEVIYPDGTWKMLETSLSYPPALVAAKVEAEKRGADLLPESMFPSCKVGEVAA